MCSTPSWSRLPHELAIARDRSAIAHTRLGRDRLVAGTVMQRHRHAIGYVAVVLAGGYLEAGDAGRRRVGPGDALVHRPFEGHLDRSAGAEPTS